MRYNNISVSISSSESDSELRAMNSATAHFARLQETTFQCALTLCHAVFTVLRLRALPCVRLRLNVRPAIAVHHGTNHRSGYRHRSQGAQQQWRG